jgi:hypothetical protein
MIDENTSTLLSDFYEDNDGEIAGASRWDNPETEELFKICIIYDVIDQ